MIGQKPLVELPSACEGKGEYVALVQYATPGGELFSKTFKYSYKDPRAKDRATVLKDISRMLSARERRHIVAVSVVKRCLYPKAAKVPKLLRTPHFERLFTAVVQHAESDFGPYVSQAVDYTALTHMLPYTKEELHWLPVTDTITTRFHQAGKAVRIPLRGLEDVVTIDDLLGFSPRLVLAP